MLAVVTTITLVATTRATPGVVVFALVLAVSWLARDVAARAALLAAALALVAVGAWQLVVALAARGGDPLTGAIAVAAFLACAATLAPLLEPPQRFALTAAVAAALGALALFVFAGPLRAGGDARWPAALFSGACAAGCVLAGADAQLAAVADGNREAPLAARMAIAAMLGLGTLVLVGWLLGNSLIVQGGTGFVPMQFNSALAVLATGGALAAALRGARLAVLVLAALVVAQAGLSLLQEYAGLHVALDELFWRHRIAAEDVPRGRMAPNAAMAWLLGALGAAAALRARRHPGWWPVVWGCGLIVAAIVVLAAAGFALEIVRLRSWGEHTPMAFPTLLACAALATALLTLGLGHARARAVPAALVPLLFAISAMVLSIHAWNVLSTRQVEVRRAATVVAAQSVSDALRNFLRTRMVMFEHLAERLAPLPDDAMEAAFRDDARRILRSFPGLFSVCWIARDGTTRWIESPEPLEHGIGTRFDVDEAHRDALERARTSGTIALSQPVRMRTGGNGFVAVLPLLDGGEQRGFVAAAIRYQPLLDALLATTALGYSVELRDGAQPIYARGAPGGARLVVSSSAEVFSRRWLATVRPAQADGGAAERLPELVLFGGLVLGGLVAVALRLALLSRARATLAEAASAALRREAAERERAQLELEQSRNELTAAFDRARHSEALLRVALEGEEARNRELQDFAFVASHDLQEPLRKIRAFGERLADLGQVDAQGRDYVERMRHAAARMQTLIDDLLTYSRVATRGHAFVPVDLQAVAREVLTDLESTIEASEAQVRVGRLPLLAADATQMRQLLQNLVSNSLKFRAPGRTPVITIEAERFERPSSEPMAHGELWCRLIVRDNGIGFENRHRDRIMQPFQRLHGRGEYEGTGIGLAIVRRIVDRHGGTITVDAAPGVGATFAVELPLERPGARSECSTTLATGGTGMR